MSSSSQGRIQLGMETIPSSPSPSMPIPTVKPKQKERPETKNDLVAPEILNDTHRQQQVLLIQLFESVLSIDSKSTKPSICILSGTQRHVCKSLPLVSSSSPQTSDTQTSSSSSDPQTLSLFTLLKDKQQTVRKQYLEQGGKSGLREPADFMRFQMQPVRQTTLFLDKPTLKRVGATSTYILDLSAEQIRSISLDENDSLEYVLPLQVSILHLKTTAGQGGSWAVSVHVKDQDEKDIALTNSQSFVYFLGSGPGVKHNGALIHPDSQPSTANPKLIHEQSYPPCWTALTLAWWNYSYDTIRRQMAYLEGTQMQFYRIQLQSEQYPGCAHSLVSFWCIYYLLPVLETQGQSYEKHWKPKGGDVQWPSSNFLVIRCTVFREYWEAFQHVFRKLNPFVDLSKGLQLRFQALSPSYSSSSSSSSISSLSISSLELGVVLQPVQTLS